MAEGLARALGSWALPYFAAALLNLAFAALVQSRGRGAMRQRLSALLGSVAASLAGWGLVRVSDSPGLVLWSCRLTMAVGAWTVPASIGFATALLDEPRPRLLRAATLSALVASAAALCTPWVITGTRATRYGLTGAAGPLYLALLAHMALIATVQILITRRLGVERQSFVRRRLQWVLASSLVGAPALGDLLAPLVGDAPPIGWLPLTLGSALLLVGVVRYRLLDLRLALWRLVLWLALTVSGALPLALVAAAVVRGAPPRYDWESALLGAGLIAVMLGYLEVVQPRVEALVGQRRRSLADEMAALESQLATLQTVGAIGRAVDHFLGALGRRLAAMVVIDARGRPELALSAWGAVPVPTRDSPLLFELAQARAPISVDEVRGPARIEIERACVRWGAEYLAPLVDGEQLLGLVAISPRRQGGAARIEEVEAIDRVCVAVAAALARARLLQRLEALSQELEHKAALRSTSLERALADLRGAEARLFASEKLATLGQIVAGVAADLRDQVSAVLGLAAELRSEAEVLQQAGQAARAQLERDDRFEEMVRDLPSLLDAVGEGARRASAIAQDLYGFAPLPDRPDRAAERRLTPLDSIVDSTLTLLGAQLRGITVERRFDAALPDVPVEPGPMGQVVLNLVLNAAQAMQGHGRLEVGTRSVGDLAELFVSDSGPGIPAEVLAHIFEPFFTTKGPAAGTGLGLSVSFGIIERHGGRILVESSPGGGSTFRVQLPLR
jgi:signal transduction histidine kinase